MPNRRLFTLAVLAVATAALCAPCLAQGPSPGRIEYENQCGVCHGAGGKGDGPLAEVLKNSPPDLSVLTKVHNGVFPAQILRDIVDGRKPLAAHGDRQMPIWGKRLADQARFLLGPGAAPKQIEDYVQARIKALIGYIETLQEK